MEQMLWGIPGVVVYMDHILITGQTNVEHLNSLEEVLTEAGLRAKCRSRKLFSLDGCGRT